MSLIYPKLLSHMVGKVVTIRTKGSSYVGVLGGYSNTESQYNFNPNEISVWFRSRNNMIHLKENDILEIEVHENDR